MSGDEKSSGKSTARTRLLSLAALGMLATGIGWSVQQGYRAATDSFVAPIILSPESDAVLATKLHASQLEAERVKTSSEMERIDADIAAGLEAISRLRSLTDSGRDTRAWFTQIQGNAASAGAIEIEKIAQQRAQLAQMIRDQETLVTQARSNVESNVIARPEYTRDVLALSHLRLAMFDTERAQARAQLDAAQSRLARAALAGTGPTMPEIVAREEQMTRIELELMKLEAEQRTKKSERTTLVEKLSKIEELDGQLKARPIYRAALARVEAAFVPYTQMSGVDRGAVVYDCAWGLFRCKSVGTVAELVPGEVVMPDPWGNQTRGQYAILDLREHDAARAKLLRVRGIAGERAKPAKAGGAVTMAPAPK